MTENVGKKNNFGNMNSFQQRGGFREAVMRLFRENPKKNIEAVNNKRKSINPYELRMFAYVFIT